MLFLFLMTAAWAGPTYELVGATATPTATAEVWQAEVEGKKVVVLKIREVGKDGEARFAMETIQLAAFEKHCETLLQERTTLKPGAVQVVSTMKSGASWIDFARVRVGNSSPWRVLVVHEDKLERSFVLDKKSWSSLKKLTRKASS
ncbi:hypothetical protein DYH09_15645 [bacterium CPR1]|nr:hypothetical protein [bacterium CPR1]